MRNFVIPKNPYDSNRILYTRDNVTINNGITVLCGCNGSGKTTLLRFINRQLEKDKCVSVLYFDNYVDGGSTKIQQLLMTGHSEECATMVMSSEGERIMQSVSYIASKIGSTIRNNNPKEMWILLDAVGSGLSIDGIDEVLDFINFVQEQNPTMELYCVISTNEYEFAKGNDCIDVRTFKHMRFDDYEKYRNFILKSRKVKDKRYGVKNV